MLFAAPVASEMKAVALQLNMRENVTCHGDYAGRDVLELEELFSAPLQKVDQALKFCGVDVKAVGLRNKKKAGLSKAWSSELALRQQTWNAVGFVQSVSQVWRSIARLCDSFNMRFVLMRRDPVAHAVARLYARFNATGGAPFVVAPDDFLDELDRVERDKALLQWLARELGACAITVDMEQLGGPGGGFERMLAHLRLPEQRAAWAAELSDNATAVVVRTRADFEALVGNWQALMRRHKQQIAVKDHR